MDYADTHKGTLVVICADHETSGMSIEQQDRLHASRERHQLRLQHLEPHGYHGARISLRRRVPIGSTA